MKQVPAGIVVLIYDRKCRAAYRAGNPFFLAEMLYKGGFACAQGPMKSENDMVSRILPELAGGGGDIIDIELDFHAAKVTGKLQRRRYIISARLDVPG